MRHKFIAIVLASSIGLTLAGTACGSDSDDDTSGSTVTTESTTTTEAPATGDDTSDKTIVEIASANPDFSTLVSLVASAGLADTLSSDGPFTVFAPTDDAFDAVPAETLQQLAADPSGALADVLKLHVIDGDVAAADAMELAGQCVDTLGGKVKIAESGSDLTIGGATITQTDIAASNGVIHVIDAVITAPSTDC